MHEKYWIDRIQEAFELAENSGTDYEKAEFMKKIFDDLADEKAHHYATKEILQEIAEQIAIELTNIQEAKDEEVIGDPKIQVSKKGFTRFYQKVQNGETDDNIDKIADKIIKYLKTKNGVSYEELSQQLLEYPILDIQTVLKELERERIIEQHGYTQTDAWGNAQEIIIYHLNKDKV